MATASFADVPAEPHYSRYRLVTSPNQAQSAKPLACHKTLSKVIYTRVIIRVCAYSFVRACIGI